MKNFLDALDDYLEAREELNNGLVSELDPAGYADRKHRRTKLAREELEIRLREMLDNERIQALIAKRP